jgi:ankyrin repeat protein
MNFCDYFSTLLNGLNCCNTLNHGHGPSVGTLQLSNDDQNSSYTSSETNNILQFSLIGTNQVPETQETLRVTQILFTDDYFQSPDSNTQQIWDAVDNNDLKAVFEFISSNDVSLLEDYDGFTLLHRSVIAGNVKMTGILSSKVEISAKDNVGRTALHYACMKNDVEIIKLLLNATADPLAQDSFGKVALDYCAKNSESQKVFGDLKPCKKISDSTKKNSRHGSKSFSERRNC